MKSKTKPPPTPRPLCGWDIVACEASPQPGMRSFLASFSNWLQIEPNCSQFRFTMLPAAANYCGIQIAAASIVSQFAGNDKGVVLIAKNAKPR